MAVSLIIGTCDPLKFCTLEELREIDKRFDSALGSITCLIFWTGVSPEVAHRWAEKHSLPTLTMALGPLYSGRDAQSPRCGKSSNAWSKYMKAASCRFAQYACRDGRRAIVLTRPPPDIYSDRPLSNYKNLEEPILRGSYGGSGTASIEYAHPTASSGIDFKYQIWPLNKSSMWVQFCETLKAKALWIQSSIEKCNSDLEGRRCSSTGPVQDSAYQHQESSQISGTLDTPHDLPKRDQNDKEGKQQNTQVQAAFQLLTQQSATKKKARKDKKKAKEEKRKAKNEKKKAKKKAKKELEREKTQVQQAVKLTGIEVKEEAKRMRAELEQRIAQTKRKTELDRLAMLQRLVEEKKELKQKGAELDRQTAGKKEDTKLSKLMLDRKVRDRKKAALQQVTELDQRAHRDRAEAKRQRVELERLIKRKKQEAGKRGLLMLAKAADNGKKTK
jgi:hypothetical protein